uniref:Protein piccolo n=1 Tax=Oncorhynchus mykiss TaxID=8022 RepID=A0A8C7RF75_ONCMY
MKSQPLPSIVSTPVALQKEIVTPAASPKPTPAPAKPQKEEIPVPAAGRQEITPPTVLQKTPIPAGTPAPNADKKEETPPLGSSQKKQASPALAEKENQEPIIVQKPVDQPIPATPKTSGAATPVQQPEKQTPPLQQPASKASQQVQPQQAPKPDLETAPLNEPMTPASEKEKKNSAPGSPQKELSPAVASQQDKTPVDKSTPTPVQHPPHQETPQQHEQQRQPLSGTPKGEPGKPQQQLPKGGASYAKSVPPPQAQPPKQESGGFFGFGGAKSQPAQSKPEDSVSGKMLGFGSSIFSSASTLITSAVQDEHRTTPPASPKVSMTPALVKETPAAGSSQKKEVSPTVVCQQDQKPVDRPTPTLVQQPPQQKTLQQQGQPSAEAPKSEPDISIVEAATAADTQNPASPVPAQKAPLENRRTSEPHKPPQQPSPGRRESSAFPATKQPPKQESGGLFGFGGPKSQSASSKPEESVSGKMFGFGSSIFSSASTLITSVVQDEPRTTPPASPKMSALAQTSPKMPPAKETKLPAAQKAEEKKAAHPQKANVPPSVHAKVDKSPSAPPKGTASSQPAPKAGQSTCPLCKVELNKGSKDPPNYNTCTECKNTVCNLCGFNPMPHETVKEWLCLTCQMQRALGAVEPPGPPMMKSQPLPSIVSTPVALQKEIVTPAASPKPTPKELSPAVASQQDKMPVDKSTPTPVQHPPHQETPQQQEQQRQPLSGTPKGEPGKPQQQLPKGGASYAKSVPPPQAQPLKQESGGFFGFGGAKSQPAQSKPEDSVSGKMLGFGSSIFSSASTLITSAVQDEHRTTPPASPKVSMTPALVKETPAAGSSQKKEVSPTVVCQQDQKPVDRPTPTLVQQPPQQKTLQQQGQPSAEAPKSETSEPHKPPQQPSPGRRESSAFPATKQPPKQESGGLLGFGGPKSQSASSKPEESVSGKMFGFGSSIFSSASTLITSVVQDEPRTTPPASPKMSALAQTSPKMPPAKETKLPAAQNAEEMKAAHPQKANVPPSVHAKVDKPPSAPLKGTASSQPAPKAGQSTCPLCKVELNKGSKDPPNYNTCTECKNTVCNLCGFNPMPHETKEWLCLNCQTQRALSGQLGDMGKMAQSQPIKIQAQPTPLPVVPTTKTEPQPPAAVSSKAQTFSKTQPPSQAVPLTSVPTPPTPIPVYVLIYQCIGQEHFHLMLFYLQEKEKEPTAASLLADQVVAEVPSSQASSFEADIKPEDYSDKSQDGPDIFPISQGSYTSEGELSELQTVSDVPIMDTTPDTAMPAKEEGNGAKRLLSYVPMEESSGSEPSPSPKLQRRRLSAIAVSTAASSSSEDYKDDSPTDSPPDSPDSFVNEEELIRRQIMGMMREEMSLSEEEENEEKEGRVEETMDAVGDNTSCKSKPLLKKGSIDDEDSPARIPSLPGSEPKSIVESAELHEKITVYKKAMPMTPQRTKSMDDGDSEVENITDSLEDRSKGEGSSSVQVSSFTPGTSPTSASSLEEDSDSSPSHKRSGEGKQPRKAKHRHTGQPFPTTEDSSEEEELREEEDHLREQEKPKDSDQQQGKRISKKSKRDKDDLRAQRRRNLPLTSPCNLSSIEDASPTEEARQAREMEALHRTSVSDYFPSMESDSDAFHTETRIVVSEGQKFSTAKPLKSAEDEYEEMLQIARSLKGETEPFPEIELLYEGMAIEDYLYESLVEEPEAKRTSAPPEQPSKDPAKEPGKKGLRSPEEVYEEMMLKKKELMLIEQEFQKVQSAINTPNPEIHVTAPSSAAAESCRVGEAEGEKPMLDAGSTYVKRKKRPAPPRPSEPPKRPEVYVAKPTVPQDMTMRRALFPIPDLKITQCSSGEDETDDSIIEEYGVGVSYDITPSYESETKKELESTSASEHAPTTEVADIEPITVVCEVSPAKATPAPVFAPETVLAPSTTTTPSQVSPVSPPTSPSTPDSSLASNATSSSSFQARSPLSSDSTAVSTPTPDLAKAAGPFAAQPPIDISPPSIAPIMAVSPTTVLVTIQDLVTDLTQAPAPATTTANAAASPAQAPAPAPASTPVSAPASVVVQIPDPYAVQMPDLVRSPSQMAAQVLPSVQVRAQTPIPSPVHSQSQSPVPAAPSAVPTPVSAPTPAPAPVVVQMPDMVTITSPVSPQAPLPASAPAPAQATVVQSVPVQAAAPAPVVVPAAGTPRIQRQASTKKAPPPPPPRSMSVSLPQTSAEPTSIRAVQHVSPTMTTTIAIGAGLPSQPIQSVVVDIQPQVEQVWPNGDAGPQVMMTPTRQGHVVIIVPNVENMSVLSQSTQDLVAYSVAITTTSTVDKGSSLMAAGPVVVSVAPFPTAPSVPAVPSSDTCIPVADTPPPPTPPPPPATLPKPAVYPKKPSVSTPPSIPTTVPVSTAVTMAQGTVTTTGPSTVHKASAPPPVPPKPVSIPAGLVFSHRPGESIKPPVVPTASHTLPRTREVVPNASIAQPFTATTLPRTREPPNALYLSLTTPVEPKMSAASPRSPLSPRYANCLETYVVITLPSEPGTPTEGITVQAPIRRGSIPFTMQTCPRDRTTPSEQQSPITAFSQEIPSAAPQPQAVAEVMTLPSDLVTQVVTTEVQRTTVSLVHERLPQVPASNGVAITIQPDLVKVQPSPKQNGKIYSGDAIDLRTIKVGVKMTDSGMDLTPQESSRQSTCSDSSGRHTAVQPEIVNLSAEITPSTTLSVVTDSITIVTCSDTIESYTSEPAEIPLDLQGYVASMPLPLTTYKPFQPLAQIVFRRVDSPPIINTVLATDTETPINLSYGASMVNSRLPVTMAPAITNVGDMLSEPAGAVDLSTSRPLRAMAALSDKSPGVVTTVIEDDGTPIDLTAGRNVCCDVIYKLPFTGSCRTQPPVITQPDNRFGYRDDHYQYDHAGVYGIKGLSGKAMSETNLADAGLFLYDGKTRYNYNGASDSAIDLTAANMSAGEALDYTSKAAGAYTGISTAPYSQVPAYSVFRSSDGMVYSSIAAPVPSTYPITTQPGSIFSTTLPPTTTLQEQPAPAPHPYGFIPTSDPGQQIISLDTSLPKDLLPSALADIMTGFPDLYSDQTLEAIAASLDALASSPMFPGLDDSKITQYQMEREFLQLEKLKQLCLAEELEWERQEIQRYREQEQIMVQRELEELQALKQQLLMQQEEEHQAQLVAQQETYNQQRQQLEQIQQLQVQLQHQLDEQYSTTGSDNLLEKQYTGVGDNGQYWPVRDDSNTSSTVTQLEGGQYVTSEGQREGGGQDQLQLSRKQPAGSNQPGDQGYGTGVVGKRIVDSGVQTDDEDSVDRMYVGRRKRNYRKGVDSSVQTDDEEDQEVEWDMPARSRRRSRSSKHSGEGKHGGSKVSSIAIQTIAEISVQTDHSGSIKRPSIQMDTKVEIIKHISAPENSQRGGSLSCQTDADRRHHSPADITPKVLYSTVSTLSSSKAMEGGQKMLTTDPTRFSSSPMILKPGQKSMSDPKSLSHTTEDRIGYHYSDSCSGHGSSSGTGKKVKRTLPNPPPEDDPLTGPSGYSTSSARRRLGRHTTMARAKILQDIDKELDLVERESSKLRRKQAELDEEEKEIDAKLRYLEMGINRRKDALLQEREKRERAYLQGVAEERDYMSDSEVSNIRETRGSNHGLERPRTAPQSEFDQFIPPQTEADSQYSTLTSPYSHYAQYVPQTNATSHYPQQTLYQQQALYQQHPYQSQSVYSSVPSLSYPQASHSHQQAQSSGYQSKNTTNYEVIRNQPIIIVPSSSEAGYGVGKYGSLELRMGLEERRMASSPMSNISTESFYADIDHHNARNYVLIEDIEQLTKGSAGLGSGFSLTDKDLSKADRLLRAAEARRTAEVTVAAFLGNSRLHSYGKGEEDSMEEPYELKLLKQQIKQEFRRGTEGLEHLSGLGMPQYLSTDPSYRHFPKAEKYSISRLTLEKQAAKQLPAAVLYQKQIKNQKKATLMDPKITKSSPIQESRDLEPDYSSFLGSGVSSVTNLSTRARLLQDEINFGLKKNLSEQQKYLGSSLGTNLAGSLSQSLSLGGPTMRSTLQDDTTYPSGTSSRPSSRPNSRPTSVYGLDLSIKRDLSSSSLRLRSEGEALDAAFGSGLARTKPTSLPIGRIPIVAQNSEEESPLSPVGEPMGMARASAGPLPPISADSRDQFGSSHSLPEVQQHMREESRATRGHSGVYDRDIAFIMDDLGGAMSDSEAYHLRREDTDWFDKPAERQHRVNGQALDRRQVRGMKLIPYVYPHTRIKVQRDPKDSSVSGNGLGIRVVGGKEIPGSRGEIGAYIAKVTLGGVAEQTGKVVEGMQVLEWNGVPLMGKTYEEVQCIMSQPCAEAELCVRLDLNMLSDADHPQALENHAQLKPGDRQRSPGVDPRQLAAELQKVSQQQAPGMGLGVGGPVGVLSALDRSALLHSGNASASSSAVPSPGQPTSPAINKKQRHSTKPQPRPVTGEIQLQIHYDRNLGNLIVHVLQARNLAQRDPKEYSDPFVKVYLLPGRGQVMVVQNASAENKRRTKYVQRSLNPEWNQTVIYKNIHLEQLKKKTLEVTVWDYDRSSSNDFLGEVLIDLSNTSQLDNTPRWLPLKEQSESIEHSRTHHTCHESPKNSVIKSRSHGIFPDPAKDMQMVTLEKSHSSPGSSKSSSDGQLRSHGPSRSQSKSSVTQAHLEDAGIAIAAAEAAVQQSRLQPSNPQPFLLGDVSGPVVSSAPSLMEGYGGLDGDEGAGTGVDRGGGKTQVMGEIKVALKKEVKQEGDQLILEVLQCRNITYKFKSPDHLPDLYVKLYVVNVATQKRIIKKKTRVCRHDREPSFNETFRFSLNPTGHSLQLFLVSNGGKFMKKTLIGEAYIWLDKVDMRKRVVSWHKLLVSSTHNQS